MTDAACITAEGLNLQSALAHSKHEMKLEPNVEVNCAYFYTAVLLYRFWHLFDLSCSLPVSEQPLTLSQCSWTGTAARRQPQRHFTRWCNSSTRGACRPTCSHPVGVAADHPNTHPHSHASLPTAHYVPGILSSVVHHTWREEVEVRRTGHAAPSQTERISLSVWRRPAAFCIITRWVNHREWC